MVSVSVNSSRPRPNRRHFTDDIFKCIFENENEWISPRISLKFVPKFRINNIPALVQIMAWRRPGDKPLSETMMVSLLTHICVTRPQWVNSLWPSGTIWCHKSGSTLAQVMACCLTAPSHYLNQCWLIISEVQWHSSKKHFRRDTSTVCHQNKLEIYLLVPKVSLNSPRANELTHAGT